MRICDTCKRTLEEFHAWSEGLSHKPILFHGRNMNNGDFKCFEENETIKYRCLRKLIRIVVKEDEEDYESKNKGGQETKAQEATTQDRDPST